MVISRKNYLFSPLCVDLPATVSALYCEIPNVQRGEVEAESDVPQAVYVPHGQSVRLTCDKGYVVTGTLDASAAFTCNRSDSQTEQGSFGPDWEDIACVGMFTCKSLSEIVFGYLSNICSPHPEVKYNAKNKLSPELNIMFHLYR